MTTEEFYKRVIEILTWAEQTAPISADGNQKKEGNGNV